ncbi:MAG: type VI secretion system protein TssA [Pirellulaceae bacterium]|nr:type VI secretion system protein TssA [Pirellulaceae bacterium]
MSKIDVDRLLEPVSADAPCGENLEYDADYAAMELAAAGKPEQQFGSTLIPAEDPEWGEVLGKAIGLLERSKDLRVGLKLALAGTRAEGSSGLAASLAVLHGLIEKHWDKVHPQLDPDDDNDPTIRINTIASLCDPTSMLRFVRETPLVKSRAMGSFSYRDVLVASGEMPPPAEGTKPDQAAIDAAFSDVDSEQLKATAADVALALEMARSIEQAVTDQVGVSRAPSLEGLTDILKGMNKLLQSKLEVRGLLQDDSAAADPAAETDAPADSAAAENAKANGHKAGGGQKLTGEIASREDVIRAIDKICDYYKRYEPSSPVPLFLNRAKRLASKSFLEILRDLTPDALSQALALGGIADASEISSGDVDPNDV